MFITRGNLPEFKILLFNVGRRGIKGGRGVNMGKGDEASPPMQKRRLRSRKGGRGEFYVYEGEGGGGGRI